MKTLLPVALLFCLFGLAACSSSKPAPQTGLIDGPQEVVFFDSDSFDRRFAATLEEEPELVTMIFPAAITTNEIPERLDKWLLMVEEKGGQVELRPVQAQRGFIKDALTLAKNTYNSYKNRALYRPIQYYNATVYYEMGTGKIARIEFIRKMT